MYLKSPWKVLEKGMSWSVGTIVNTSKTTEDLYHLQKNVFAFSQSQRQRAKDIDVINRRSACDVI